MIYKKTWGIYNMVIVMVTLDGKITTLPVVPNIGSDMTRKDINNAKKWCAKFNEMEDVVSCVLVDGA